MNQYSACHRTALCTVRVGLDTILDLFLSLVLFSLVQLFPYSKMATMS